MLTAPDRLLACGHLRLCTVNFFKDLRTPSGLARQWAMRTASRKSGGHWNRQRLRTALPPSQTTESATGQSAVWWLPVGALLL